MTPLQIEKEPLRFAIGHPNGMTSNSWRIWFGPDATIYIACRDNYQELKASLHPELWQFGLTAEYWKSQNLYSPKCRHWEQWRPPPELAPGVSFPFRIEFIHSELAIGSEIRVGRKWNDPVYIEPAPGFESTVVTVAVTNQGTHVDSDTGPIIKLASEELPDSRELQVLVTGGVITDSFRETLQSSYVGAINRADGEQRNAVRLLLFGQDDNGTRFLTEMNANRPFPDPLFGPLEVPLKY